MGTKEKTVSEELSLKLCLNPKGVFDVMGEKELKEARELGESYKEFLNVSKTERLCAIECERLLTEAGFSPLGEGELKAGRRFYRVMGKKAVIAGIVGEGAIEEGLNIAVAHTDSPRIDLKPNPLYEEEGLALFKTHYYGGIKKYQWTAIPLALYGVVVRADGTAISIAIGDGPNDPVFCISDLLPHLAADQMAKKLSEGITGEGLNVMVGSEPYPDPDAKSRVKLKVLSLLNEKYDMTEEDFYSAELTLVPAFSPRDVGFDRSLIGAYGHDDRVCAYGALKALMDIKDIPKRTALCVLADKEEVGSMGVTGMQSRFFENFVEELCEELSGKKRNVLSNSACLSADVNVAFDPNYPDVSDKRNTSRAGGGVAITKYTGSRGKAGSSDASAEYMGAIRSLLNDNGVLWQVGELGKVDQGGGGTVAQYLANLGIETVDCGVPVLSMHAPFEVISKGDLYMMTRAFYAFYLKFGG